MNMHAAQRAGGFWPTDDKVMAGFRDEAVRKSWMRRLGDLGRTIETGDPSVIGPMVTQARCDFSASVGDTKKDVLGNPLCWDTEERATAQWIAEAYATLARAATRIAERSAAAAAGREADALLRDLIVAALVSRGHAQKWHGIAGTAPAAQSLVRVHGLYRLAERRKITRIASDLLHDGVRHSVTIEGHYLRVLLFGYFFTGHLTRQQVEILDTWLWTWVADYHLTSQPSAGELGLWVDLQSDEGVHSAFTSPTGLDVRFLAVSALAVQLDEVIGGFHAGCIYPGYGIACDFRIEEHVAVVDFLQQLLQRLRRAGGAPRSSRRTLAMPRVEGFVGVGEILRKGLANASADGDRPRRWMRIRDVSDTGVRIVAPESDWQSIEVGDVIGFREPATSAFVIGEVVRKLPDAEPQCVQLGVSVLSRDPRRLAVLAHATAGDGKRDSLDVLYLPGDDNCGRADTLLAGESELTGFGVRDLEAGGFVHAVQVNRVRRRGRGWATAGFEVLGVTPAHQGASA